MKLHMTMFHNGIGAKIRDRQDVFSGIFAYSFNRYNLASGREVHYAEGSKVSGQFFEALGIHTVLGRPLISSDDKRGCRQPKVAETQPPPPPEQPASTLLRSTPDWMPVYPATIPEIVSSVVTPEGDKETIATFKSVDKPTEIVQFYQTKLQESGFKIEVASSGEQGGMIQAQDGEKKRMLILNVKPDETGTLSRVVTVQKK